MNSWFARLQIRSKLIILLLVTSAVVVAFASVGHLYFQVQSARADAENDLSTQAQLVLDNADAPLTFYNAEELKKVTETLWDNANVRTACLYDGAGELVSSHRTEGSQDCPAPVPADGISYETGRIVITKSASQDGRRKSTVYIRSDVVALQQRLRNQAIVIGGVLLIALGFAVVLSARLQRLVSEPIVDLSRTASAIASAGDYSVRAQRHTDDEIGALVDAFNGMLATIQSRDAELSQANDELRREVAERRRAEQERADLLVREREANRLKDEFLATLSHELRTPLNAILGWTRLLRGGALAADGIDRALEKVERNAQAQTRLVEDLLEVSRITTGKLRLEMKDYDLASAAHRAVDSIRPTAEARGVRLEHDLPAAGLLTSGDADRIQQVIWNLLSNAVKFTPPGGRVSVTVERRGPVDEIIVADTGTGIDAAFLPYVFDTFRQADASPTRAYGGLGLGLAIVRNLVELHGGEVSAESGGADQGATFTVRLPVRSGRSESSPDRRGSLPVAAGALSGVTILAVDDDLDTRELLQSILEAAGARVYAAGSVDDALLTLQHERPDALVSDIGMPGRDGYTLLHEVRAMLGERSPRVAIAVSAYASEQDRVRSAAAGYHRHIAKPIDPAALVDILRQLLETGAAAS